MIRPEVAQPNHGGYLFYMVPVTRSAESGPDNPFRPDGDISKEADEIVQLIKSGRPLNEATSRRGDATDAAGTTSPNVAATDAASEPLISPKSASHPNQQKPEHPSVGPSPAGTGKADINGSANSDVTPGTVEVTHATVTPTEAAHVEHVVIKKKNKCSCCVIQ